MNKQQSKTNKEKRMRYYLKNYTTQASNFTVIQKKLTGHSELHSHNYFEIEFIVYGRGTQYLNGTPYEIKPGNIYLVTPADFHEHEFTEPTEIINISFDSSILPQDVTKKLADVVVNKNYYLSDGEYDKYYLLINILLNEYNNSFTWRNDAILNILQYIVIFFLRRLNFSETKKEPNTDIDTALAYINIHFKENPSLSDVANHIHYNPSYFSQLFKKYTGTK